MPIQATLFSRLLQRLPWAVLDRAVAAHGMDQGHRGLDARSHLVALVAGQLIEARGLRAIEVVLRAHAPLLQRQGLRPACRSTLADANRTRPAAAFEALIPALLAELSPAAARRAEAQLRLLDATLVTPGRGAEAWARFQNGRVAAKVHVVYDPDAEVPTFYELTAANTNGPPSGRPRPDRGDITVAKSKMPIEPGAIYVFDLGYYDFGFWAALDRQGCRFVTRLKKNTPVRVLAERAPPAGGNIGADRTVQLPQRLAQSRTNPFARPGRLISVTTEQGRRLALFSNDLASPAERIAELYRTRWRIELFFRWIKQNLRIRHFHGRSANAVRLQIIAAIVTCLLLALWYRAAATTKTVALFLTALRHALFQRLDLATLVARLERRSRPRPAPPPHQLEFAW
jgi:hypothetical protein